MQIKQFPGERRSQFEERRKLLQQMEKVRLRGKLDKVHAGPNRAFRRKHPELVVKKTGEDPK